MIYYSLKFELREGIGFADFDMDNIDMKRSYIKNINMSDCISNIPNEFREVDALRLYKISASPTVIFHFVLIIDISKDLKMNVKEFVAKVIDYIYKNIEVFAENENGLTFTNSFCLKTLGEMNIKKVARVLRQDCAYGDSIPEHNFCDNIDNSYVIPKNSYQKILEANIKNRLFYNSLKKECNRINKSKKDEFYGHPTHYIIYKNDMFNEMAEILIDSLVNNNRLISRRAQLHTSVLCNEVFHKVSVGSTLFMEIGQISGLNNNTAFRSSSSVSINEINSAIELCKKYRHKVLYVFIVNSKEGEDIVRDIAGDSMSFYTIGIPNNISYTETKRYLSARAKEDGFSKFLGKVENRTYSESEIYEIFDKWKDDYIRSSIYTGYKNVNKSTVKKYIKGNANKELEKMIGLSGVKETVKEIIAYFNMQKKYKEKNIILNNACRHMIFTGNPGTAKTTVARLISQILKDNGILESGKYIETGRSELVEQYVGWTAKNTKAKILAAKGGVLFIDEAYSLMDGKDKAFGQEAIDTLVEMMDIIKDDTIIIFAGYPDEMEKFINTNPGIRSRIGFHVKFPNYTEDELIDILKLQASKQNITITDNALNKARKEIKEKIGSKDFGNGRFVRGLLEKSLMKKSVRHMEEEDSDIFTLTSKDIANISIGKPIDEKKVGFVGN